MIGTRRQSASDRRGDLRDLLVAVRASPSARFANPRRMRRDTALIIAGGNAIGAAQQATSTTAIIGSFIGEDPIAAGFAVTLTRPGG
jgi:hypothetical protein